MDLTVTLTAFPTLVILALLLDRFLTPDWTETSESASIVLALMAACLAVSLFTVGYIIYRLGIRLWAGPQAMTSNLAIGPDGQLYCVDINPPSYEIAIQEVDLDLPTYESIVGVQQVIVTIPEPEKGILHM